MTPPPPRALPTDTTALPLRRQLPIRLRRRHSLPETPMPLRRRRCLPETPCRCGTATAMATMSYSQHLARHCPRFLLV